MPLSAPRSAAPIRYERLPAENRLPASTGCSSAQFWPTQPTALILPGSVPLAVSISACGLFAARSCAQNAAPRHRANGRPQTAGPAAPLPMPQARFTAPAQRPCNARPAFGRQQCKRSAQLPVSRNAKFNASAAKKLVCFIRRALGSQQLLSMLAGTN